MLFRSPAAHPLTAAEAGRWMREFFDALRTTSGPGQPDPLEPLFLPKLLDLPEPNAKPDDKTGVVDRSVLLSTLHRTVSLSVPWSAGEPSPATILPGGRQRIAIPVKMSRGDRRFTWTADLVFSEGRWQCAQFLFQTPHALTPQK